MVTVEELEEMSRAGFDDVDINELPELADIRIDESLRVEERGSRFMEAVGNPYLLRVGNTKVKIRFSNNGQRFQDNFCNMLASV